MKDALDILSHSEYAPTFVINGSVNMNINMDSLNALELFISEAKEIINKKDNELLSKELFNS